MGRDKFSSEKTGVVSSIPFDACKRLVYIDEADRQERCDY